MGCRAKYFVEEQDFLGRSVVIRDVGTSHVSVTNDAEAVVKELLAAGTLAPDGRLFYYDSDGRLDELEHDGERFTGFAPGGGA